MSFVSGNSESVRQLQRVFASTVAAISANTEQLEKGKNYILAAWNDEGAAEVEEIVSRIRKAIVDSEDAVKNISSSLEAYAEFLERK